MKPAAQKNPRLRSENPAGQVDRPAPCPSAITPKSMEPVFPLGAKVLTGTFVDGAGKSLVDTTVPVQARLPVLDVLPPVIRNRAKTRTILSPVRH
ncbi:MAG: hypothetical protein JWM59_3485 [Verrucomicrobiales bacterium]|nr:hypothetical protein [Verrucomicrobiales bacterium]